MLSIASLPPRAPPVVLARSPPPSSPFGSSLVPSSIDSCVKDGRRIRVGDCALFQAGDAPPFIGLIRWLSIDKEDCLKVCVNWLYRPADIKLPKGILLEAAPNEVFYSFHKDVITAASLLHPCKIYFLRKGVELPAGISSFVCRRVYDIANKCLWWLTDQDYINERQEEVDHLLDKTQLEMHAAVQSGGRSPKSLNGPTSTQLLKSSSDSVQTSGASFSSQANKGKKRDRGGDQGTEPIKRERLSNKPDDVESVSPRIDMIKSEVAKITEKGALISLEGCEKLVHLMQLNRNEKLDLAGRIMLADVIAGTDKIECVSRIVQLRGVPILDDWLQEAHKGKTGDGSSPKESDKGSENLLFALLRALDKLPVNLNALQSCNIGKSVNNLRSHKNPEIQKKARSLVDTWKKRVDAEIAKNSDAKSGGPSTQAVTLSAKTSSSDVPQLGSKATVKTLISQSSPCNKTQVNNKHGHIDAIVKSMPVTPVVMKSTSPSSLPSSVAVGWKDSPGKGGADSSGNYSELPLATAKEENSNSSQSQYNSQSCSSDHAKTLGSSCKEDLRSSTTGSLSASKTFGSSSGHRSFSNGFVGNNASGGQKDSNLCKTIKVSNPSGLSSESAREIPSMDHGNNHRLVVRIPNSGRSPAQSTGGGSLQGPSIKELRHDDVKDGIVRSVVDSGLPPAGLDEELGRETNSSFGNVKGVSSLIEPKSRNSLNALIESFAKFSEPSASLSSGDEIGMNLLASVAAGEMSSSAELVSVSPTVTPAGSPKQEPCTANDEAKSTILCEPGMAQSFGQSEENPDSDSVKSLLASEKLNDISKIEVKSSAVEGALKIDLANEPAIDESKPAYPTCEKTADGTIVVIFDPGGGEDAATWADTGNGFGESDPHPGRYLNSSAVDMLQLADAVGFIDKFWDPLGPYLKYSPDAISLVVNKLFEPLTSLPCSLMAMDFGAGHARLQICASFTRIARAADKSLLPRMKDLASVQMLKQIEQGTGSIPGFLSHDYVAVEIVEVSVPVNEDLGLSNIYGKEHEVLHSSISEDTHMGSELIYAYAKIDKLSDIEEVILMPNVANLQNVGDLLHETAKFIFVFISNWAKLAVTLVKIKQFQGAVEAARKANSSKTWRKVDDLEEVSDDYQNRGCFNKLIVLKESGLGFEEARMGIFTELGVLYARYCSEKLMEHITLFSNRLNPLKLLLVCDEQQHWKELTYLYTQYDEFNNVAATIMTHFLDACDHTGFKDVVKVAKVELSYKTVQFYLKEHLGLINDLEGAEVANYALNLEKTLVELPTPVTNGTMLIIEDL